MILKQLLMGKICPKAFRRLTHPIGTWSSCCVTMPLSSSGSSRPSLQSDRTTVGFQQHANAFAPGLPDIYWYSMPKRENKYQMNPKYTRLP
jgi:hypothetical protein